MAQHAKKSIETLMKEGLLWSAQSLNPSAREDIALEDIAAQPDPPRDSQANSPLTSSFLSAPFGIEEIDQALPKYGLASGVTHEFMLSNALSSRDRYQWQAPLTVMTTLLRNAYERHTNNSFIFWIGKQCWPSPHLLRKIFYPIEEKEWAKLCFFIDPPDKDMRLWSIMQTLRSPSSFAVIADASRLSTTASRQLQLAVKGKDVFAFLARPPWEEKIISAAQTRWKLCSQSSLMTQASARNGSSENTEKSGRRQKRYSPSLDKLSWSLELLRMKGGSIRTRTSSNNYNESRFHDEPCHEEHHEQTRNKCTWNINWSITAEDPLRHIRGHLTSHYKESARNTSADSREYFSEKSSLRLTLSQEGAEEGSPLHKQHA